MSSNTREVGGAHKPHKNNRYCFDCILLDMEDLGVRLKKKVKELELVATKQEDKG